MPTSAEPTPDFDQRLFSVHARIADSAASVGRSVNEITLVAVSKTQSIDAISAAISCGVSVFGENRVQEADPKITQLGRTGICWNLIGHLQSNKARRAVNLFDVIQSLDSVELAQRLDRLCAEAERAELDVFIQVDLAGEQSKTGIEPYGVAELVDCVAACSRLKLRGFMAVPPYFEEAENVRPYFRKLRELGEVWTGRGAFAGNPAELSMGMSHDFEVAIQEGATIVRVGTALFGARLTA